MVANPFPPSPRNRILAKPVQQQQQAFLAGPDDAVRAWGEWVEACVCLCVCLEERKTEREWHREGEIERESESQRVSE